jgi:hypothetical protein
MAFTTINKSSDHFKAIKYTGTGSSNAITGVGHQPDFLWIKKANGVEHHILIDAVRGLDKQIYSSHTSSEDTNAQSVTAVGADGFTVGTNAQTNANSSIFIAQLWKAGGGSGSANADGSISSTVSTNTTAGFSIVKWVGTGANATIGHGLGVAPSLLISKNYDTATNWYVYHKSLGATKNVRLNLTNASATETAVWNDTAPTNSVFSVGTNTSVNNSGDNTITYCFAEKKGFSKFGTYKGNGSSDGVFVYTGFKPAWVMTKYSHSGGTGSWLMYNTGLNPTNKDQFFHHEANTTATWVDNTDRVDLYSNGFKFVDSTNSDSNTSGGYYVYMAFAEAPFVGTNNIPATAR